MTGPQCAWLSKFFGEAGSTKFIYYYMLQGDKKGRVDTLKQLMQLSEYELQQLMLSLQISPADLNLVTDATIYELSQLKDPI